MKLREFLKEVSRKFKNRKEKLDWIYDALKRIPSKLQNKIEDILAKAGISSDLTIEDAIEQANDKTIDIIIKTLEEVE